MKGLCEVPDCPGTVYNFCGECGTGTCGDHSVPVPASAYEEGYVCPSCAERPDIFPTGCIVHLDKLHPDHLGDDACPIVPGIIGKVIDDDDDNGHGISVEWQMPFNPVKWTVEADCLTRLTGAI